MDDAIGEVLAQRKALDRGAGAGIVLSIILHAAITAAAVYAALRKRFSDATVDTQDGLRLAWPDRWLHVRPSNTEPIVRLIAEAPAGGAAQQLVDEGKRLCGAA